MNLRKVSNDNVLNVSKALMAYRDVQWLRANAALPFIQRLDETELWLLSFVQYFVSFNRVWATVEESMYYGIPCSVTQQATFYDFITMIREYKGNRVTKSNEKSLIVFLCKCVTEHRDFYMALISKPEWVRDFFMKKELKAYSDASLIRAEDIYSKPTLISEGFDSIAIPFMVTAVPRSDLEPALIYRSGTAFRIYRHHVTNKNNRSFTRTLMPATWLKTDRKFIHQQSFVLLGLMDYEGGKFYPIDYFSDLREYSKYQHKEPPVKYTERMEKLDKFMDTNFLRQIQRTVRVVCHHESELPDAIAKVLTTQQDTVLFCDGYNRTRFAEPELREGVIGGIWTEEGEAKGFEVWHNAQVFNCSFNFTGENTALLHSPKLAINRHVMFHKFTFKHHFTCVVQDILWDYKPYRRGAYRFSNDIEGFIERCPVCLRNDTKHYYDGVCVNTWQAWRSAFVTHGPDKWFPASRKIVKRRAEIGWTPEFVNSMRATFKGHKIVANEDGEFMFMPDPETMARYEKMLESNSRRGI